MPNFDTGHLFLTFLSPIKAGATTDPSGTTVSHEQLLRITLGLLPTALQSPATQKIGVNSPFARNRQTHLCRFVVLDDVVYNGRDPKNALVMSLSGEDPIDPQPLDRLNCSYLLFTADVDAVLEEGEALPETLDAEGQAKARDAYLRRLWNTMESELRSIYGNCVGFDGVDSADDFARYMTRCQVETTMPFNDYWDAPPKLSNLPVTPMATAALVPLAVALLGAVGFLFGMPRTPILGMLFGWTPGLTFLLGALVGAAVIYGLYRYVLANGQKPMPPGKYADLQSVLKSLYLQQNFATFVVDGQGRDPAALHKAFGDFLEEHKPEDKMAPSQAPGVISIAAENGIIK